MKVWCCFTTTNRAKESLISCMRAPQILYGPLVVGCSKGASPAYCLCCHFCCHWKVKSPFCPTREAETTITTIRPGTDPGITFCVWSVLIHIQAPTRLLNSLHKHVLHIWWSWGGRYEPLPVISFTPVNGPPLWFKSRGPAMPEPAAPVHLSPSYTQCSLKRFDN